jgi:hypothetical protein
MKAPPIYSTYGIIIPLVEYVNNQKIVFKEKTVSYHSLLCSLSRLSEEQREMIMNSDDRNEIFRTIAGTGLYESVLNGGKKPE